MKASFFINLTLVSMIISEASFFSSTRHGSDKMKFGTNKDRDDNKLSSSSSVSGRDLIIAQAIGLCGDIIKAGIIVLGFRILERAASGLVNATLSLPSLHHHDTNITRFLKQNMSLNNYEYDIASAAFVNPEIMHCKDFNDIGGLTDIKDAMTEFMADISAAVSEGDKKIKAMSALLLYGPPGCGKTALVNALCKRSNLPMLRVSSSVLLHKYLGESERLTKAVFTLAAKIQPCILFFDEVDALFRSRNDEDMTTHRNLKTEGMQLIDGLAESGAKVLLVAATNRPNDLDPALVRRFERAFLVGYPAEDARLEIFRSSLALSDLEIGFSFRALAKMTKGYTPCDIVNACNLVALKQLRLKRSSAVSHREFKVPEAAKPISLKEMIKVLKSHKPTSQVVNEYGAGFGFIQPPSSSTSSSVRDYNSDVDDSSPTSTGPFSSQSSFPGSTLHSARSSDHASGAMGSGDRRSDGSGAKGTGDMYPANTNTWSFWGHSLEDEEEDDDDNAEDDDEESDP